ncbi:hypothetical protein FACS1894123_11690 [Bacteroidia bacterium]|nr:hypothetical protein FACS1894123_11690 [Bacteroidia bacterium]
MYKKLKYLLFFFLISVPVFAQSKQETNYGAIFAFEGEKALGRNLSLGIEEEIRLIDNTKGFDRNVISAGLDYFLFNRKVKVGAYYAFLYLYNGDDYFEPRHRYYFNFSYKETVNSFILSWRGRIQGTYRDENYGSYKVNPKYVMKNKFEIDYAIWGSPWKPYISADMSTLLNDPVAGRELTRIRFQGGANWRWYRNIYLDFFLRWDEYPVRTDPRVLSVGASYKIKF